MSRIGKQPITVPDGVQVSVSGSVVDVKGSQGNLTYDVPAAITVKLEDGVITCERVDDTKVSKSLHGLVRSLIANMLEGVSKGYSKELEINGVGFKAVAQGRKIELSLGFASPIPYEPLDGVQVDIDGGTKLKISGPDKQKVGQVAARIRSFFPAEPYKGKGIQYKGEHIRRKVGKTVA